jgi:O-antigen/teichoic acid export membrane protein
MLSETVTKLVRHSFVYGSGNFAIAALGFFLIPIYTRYLNPSDYGILASVEVISGLLIIFFSLGLPSAVMRYYVDIREPVARQKYLGNIWLFSGVVTALATALLLCFSQPVFQFIFKELPFSPYIQIGILTVFFANLNKIPLNVFRIQQKPHFYVLFTVLLLLVNSTLIIILVAGYKKGALGALQGRLGGALIIWLLLTFIMFRQSRPSFDMCDLVDSLKFGVPLIFNGFFRWIVTVSDIILIERFVSLTETGLYALANKVSLILEFVILAVGFAWGPIFYEYAEKDDAPAAFGRMITYFCLVIFGVGTVIAIFSEEVTRFLAAPGYYDSARVIPVLIAALIFRGLHTVAITGIFYCKKTAYTTLSVAIGALTNIVLNIIFIPRYGMIAAAWSTVFSFAVMFFVAQYYSLRFFPLRWEYGRVITIAGMGLGLYLLTCVVNTPYQWLDILIKLLAIILYPLALFLFKFFTSSEIAKIKDYSLMLFTGR